MPEDPSARLGNWISEGGLVAGCEYPATPQQQTETKQYNSSLPVKHAGFRRKDEVLNEILALLQTDGLQRQEKLAYRN